jgi:hypothetical protein
MLLLFLTIALQSTSQVRLKVKSNIYTCYTDEENRKIAILILQGERDSTRLDISIKTIEALQAEVKALHMKSDITIQSEKLYKESYESTNKMLTKSNAKIHRLKRRGWIAIGASALLGLLAIVK